MGADSVVRGTADVVSQVAMGLTGRVAQLANLGAVGFVCLMFWQQQAAMRDQATSDRQMFRDALAVIHQDMTQFHGDSARKWEAIGQQQKSINDLAVSIRDLAGEVKTMKRGG